MSLTAQSERDLRQLDQTLRGRIFAALDRFVEQPGPTMMTEPPRGDVVRLRGKHEEYRLRVGDWRVRFVVRTQVEPTSLSGMGEVRAHILTILRILPRARAYRD